MKWTILESGRLAPAAIMAKDKALLDHVSYPLLHFYEWDQPCLTYGYFTDPSQHVDIQALSQLGIELARRPTGGGIIFHLTDFAFSVLIPAAYPSFSVNTLDNYAFINRQIAQAVARFTAHQIVPELLPQTAPCQVSPCHNFCMAGATPYDLIVQGKKVGGAAQRRTRQGLLHQGSICLGLPPPYLLQTVLKEASVSQTMKENAYCLLGNEWTSGQLLEARQELKKFIKEVYTASS